MATELERPRFVRVGEAYYPEQAWLEAFNVAALDAINGALARPATERGVFRAMRGLRDPAVYARVRNAAVARLAAETPASTRMQVGAARGRVVASLPGSPLDKPSASP